VDGDATWNVQSSLSDRRSVTKKIDLTENHIGGKISQVGVSSDNVDQKRKEHDRSRYEQILPTSLSSSCQSRHRLTPPIRLLPFTLMLPQSFCRSFDIFVN